MTKGTSQKSCRLCVCVIIKKAFFWTLYVFGSCFRTLAVILVSDFFFCSVVMLQLVRKTTQPLSAFSPQNINCNFPTDWSAEVMATSTEPSTTDWTYLLLTQPLQTTQGTILQSEVMPDNCIRGQANRHRHPLTTHINSSQILVGAPSIQPRVRMEFWRGQWHWRWSGEVCDESNTFFQEHISQALYQKLTQKLEVLLINMTFWMAAALSTSACRICLPNPICWRNPPSWTPRFPPFTTQYLTSSVPVPAQHTQLQLGYDIRWRDGEHFSPHWHSTLPFAPNPKHSHMHITERRITRPESSP